MANPIYNLARMEMNRLNFDTTRKKIKELRKEYQILDDITLRLLKENEMTNKSSDGEIMNKDDRVGDLHPLLILPPTSFSIYPKGNLLESNDNRESKRGRVESLLPVVNLAARSVSQNALDDFSHLSATHALEVLVRNQAKIDSKIDKLTHELEKLKSDVDQRVRFEKRQLKVDVWVKKKSMTKCSKVMRSESRAENLEVNIDLNNDDLVEVSANLNTTENLEASIDLNKPENVDLNKAMSRLMLISTRLLLTSTRLKMSTLTRQR
ncbi:hypothetical protein WN944_001498 [Citrus x changshan-huyou]|uniref:Uncharacterized protein n=1 Tax=Citrus x changshan-huyou TaxID=2935761 RepID=A0AAP0MH97_9ROSI